jgi:hypothetical protein
MEVGSLEPQVSDELQCGVIDQLGLGHSITPRCGRFEPEAAAIVNDRLNSRVKHSREFSGIGARRAFQAAAKSVNRGRPRGCRCCGPSSAGAAGHWCGRGGTGSRVGRVPSVSPSAFGTGRRPVARRRRNCEPAGAPGCPITTDPLGSTLWEITTVADLDDTAGLVRALWRLLGCAWLDSRDFYGIRCLGIYLARRRRHNVLGTDRSLQHCVRWHRPPRRRRMRGSVPSPRPALGPR